MDNENFIKIANRVIKDKTFRYTGRLYDEVPMEVEIDFKLKILGNLSLISVGQSKNFIGLDITILDIEPKFLKGMIKNIENNQYEIGRDMYHFKTKMEEYISSVLKIFGIQNPPVLTSIRYLGD